MYASFASELDFCFPSSRFSSLAAPPLVYHCRFRSTVIKSLILISFSGFFCLFYQYLGGGRSETENEMKSFPALFCLRH